MARVSDIMVSHRHNDLIALVKYIVAERSILAQLIAMTGSVTAPGNSKSRQVPTRD